MMHTNDSNKVDQVYEILKTYGPATAMNYMQRASGGLYSFPPSVLMQVNIALRVQQQTSRSAPQIRKRKPLYDEVAPGT